MSDDEKIIVELTREEYDTLKEMLQGQRAVKWLRDKSKMLAVWLTAIIAAGFALAELIARLAHHSTK